MSGNARFPGPTCAVRAGRAPCRRSSAGSEPSAARSSATLPSPGLSSTGEEVRCVDLRQPAGGRAAAGPLDRTCVADGRRRGRELGVNTIRNGADRRRTAAPATRTRSSARQRDQRAGPHRRRRSPGATTTASGCSSTALPRRRGRARPRAGIGRHAAELRERPSVGVGLDRRPAGRWPQRRGRHARRTPPPPPAPRRLAAASSAARVR